MEWSSDRWQWSAGQWHSAFRIELRVQAIGLVARGWPVLPGTYPSEDRWIGRSGREANGPAPVHTDWEDRLVTNPDDAAACWSEQQPYSLLLATGSTVEAIEVDSHLGRRTASVLRAGGFPAPIVSTPDGRWYFLTEGGQTLGEELDGVARIRLHTTGSWVPMPPTTYPQGLVHWRVKPDVCAWRLPRPELVQKALCAGLYDSHDVAGLVAAGH